MCMEECTRRTRGYEGPAYHWDRTWYDELDLFLMSKRFKHALLSVGTDIKANTNSGRAPANGDGQK